MQGWADYIPPDLFFPTTLKNEMNYRQQIQSGRQNEDPNQDQYIVNDVDNNEAWNMGLKIKNCFNDYMSKAKGYFYKLPPQYDNGAVWELLGKRCMSLGMPAEIFVGIAFKTLEKYNRLRYSIFPKTLLNLNLDRELVEDFQRQKQIEDNGEWLQMLEDNFQIQVKSQKNSVPPGYTAAMFVCSKPWFRMPAWFRLYKSHFNPELVEIYGSEALEESRNDSRIGTFLKTITPISLEEMVHSG